MKTLIATDDDYPRTWEAAADKAVEAIFGQYDAWPPEDDGGGVTELRNELEGLIAWSFDGDNSPKGALSSMACIARDQLAELGRLPAIEQIVTVLANKQAAYGTGNILSFGQKGIIIRVSDKVARIANMLERDRSDDVEPLDDAYLDIIGYATISLMLERGWFSLPLERDVAQADDLLAEWIAENQTVVRPTADFVAGSRSWHTNHGTAIPSGNQIIATYIYLRP